MSTDTDFKYFTDNLASLYKEYGHRFIVIKDRHVIGVYDEFVDAFYKTVATEEPGTFIIQECVDNPDKLIVSVQGNVTFA